jgi:hypothetical protein
MLYEGKILDGRNRYNACIAAGVEPRYIDYEGHDRLRMSYLSTSSDATSTKASAP